MAEAYRGLTIRIGGDTTGLSRALRSVNSAITQTQGQLRNLSTALRLDPNNAKAAELQVGAIARQATNTAAKLETLKAAYDQLRQAGTASSKGNKTIEELAKATDNAALAAQRAKENYNEIDKLLEQTYIQASKLSKEFGNDIKFDYKNSSMSALREELNAIAEAHPKVSEKVRDIILEAERLKAAWKDSAKELQDMQNVQGLEKLAVDIQLVESQATSLNQQFVQLSRVSNIAQGLEGVDTKVRMIDTAAESARERFEALDHAVQLDPRNVELVRQRTAALEEVTSLAGSKAALLQQKLQAYRSAGIDKIAADTKNAALNAELAAKEYGDAQKEVARLKGELHNLQAEQTHFIKASNNTVENWVQNANAIRATRSELVEATARANEAKKAFDVANEVVEYKNLEAAAASVGSEMRELSGVSGSAMDNISSAVAILSSAFMGYIRQGLDSAITSAREIDAAYRDMRKTVNASEEQYESLKQAAIEFSQTHVTSADQMLEVEALAGQFGIAAENLESFSEAISNLDVATDIDVEDAALKVGQMVNVMRDFDETEVDKFADALVRLGNNVPATESTIMQIAQRISAVGSISGFTTPEVLAWSAALASTGQKAEAASTALSKTITQIESAVQSGGDNLNTFARVAGMSADEFTTAWNTKPTTALQAFIEGLRGMGEENESTITTLEELGITGVRQTQALLGLTETVDMLDDSLAMSEDAWNGLSDQWGAAGDAAIEAEKKAQGLSGLMSIMENNARNLGAELGEGFIPIVRAVNDILQDTVRWLHNMDDGTKTLVVGVGGIAIAASALLPILQAVTGAWASLVAGIGQLSALQNFKAWVELYLLEPLGAFAAAHPVIVGGLGAIAAALAIGGAVYSAYGAAAAEAERKQTRLIKAEKESSPVIRDVSRNMREETRAALELRDSVNDASEAHDRLAETFRYNNGLAQENIDNLSWAKDIIGDYANQTDLTAGQQAQLQEAIEMVNAACGTQYSLVDSVNGVIQDEEGVTLDTVDAINEYIDAKQRAMQIDAMLENQKAAYATLLEDQRNYQDALKTIRDLEARGVTSGQEYYAAAEALSVATDNVNESAAAYGYYTDAINEAGGAEATFAEQHAELVGNMALVTSAFNGVEEDANKFMQALSNAGISQEAFGYLSDETVSKLIKGYDEATGTVQGADEALAELKKKAEDDVEIVVAVYGEEKLREVKEIADGLTSKTVDIVTNMVTNVTSNFGKSATGGWDVRKFATGAIFTRPTLVPQGIIGEAGAEYYDGSSIVPLTNTKYSKPFIDLLAAGVANRLGGSGGSNYNISFNNIDVNNDEAIKAALMNLMVEVNRRWDM